MRPAPRTQPKSAKDAIATLNNGVQMPLIGLGCASGVRAEHMLTAMRESGYRLLDTAAAYAWGYHEDEVRESPRPLL